MSSYDIIKPDESNIDINNVPIILTFHKYDGSPLENIDNILDFESVIFEFTDKFEITSQTHKGFVDCQPNKFGIHESG